MNECKDCKDADEIIEGLVRAMTLWASWEDGIPVDSDVFLYWERACEWLGLNPDSVSISDLNRWRAERASGMETRREP